MKPLTDRQAEVLDAICQEYKATGSAHLPSIRRMAELLGIRSTNAVVDHLELLAKKGMVERSKEKWSGSYPWRLTVAGARRGGVDTVETLREERDALKECLGRLAGGRLSYEEQQEYEAAGRDQFYEPIVGTIDMCAAARLLGGDVSGAVALMRKHPE